MAKTQFYCAVAITMEANRGIFKSDKDYGFYIELVKFLKEQYELKIFAYCLLPERVKFIVEGSLGDIRYFQKALENTYGVYLRNVCRGETVKMKTTMTGLKHRWQVIEEIRQAESDPQIADKSKYPWSSYRTRNSEDRHWIDRIYTH